MVVIQYFVFSNVEYPHHALARGQQAQVAQRERVRAAVLAGHHETAFFLFYASSTSIAPAPARTPASVRGCARTPPSAARGRTPPRPPT